MSRENKMRQYDIPVVTKCIPATPGTKAIVPDENGNFVIGPQVVAWTIGIRQSKHGDIWPDDTWLEPVVFDQKRSIEGVVHPDGSVDFGPSLSFESVSDWMKYMDEARKTMNEKSCVGCKFLYSEGQGYSNYSLMETEVRCAKDKNPNLPALEVDDWTPQSDNWPATNSSRCELYAHGEMVAMDVDGEDGPATYTQDEEAITAICEHSGRERTGQ